MRIWFLLFMLFFASLAEAQWTFRPQVGVGFTDNANYEETEKDSDLFWWVRSSNTYREYNSRWNLLLNYRGYSREYQNNFFSYRFGDTIGLKTHAFGDLDWDLAVGGQQYTQGNPGTTEQSFSNIYAETSLLKTWGMSSRFDLSFEPLFQVKQYPSLDNRTDESLLFNLAGDWNFNPSQSLNPFFELGLVFSNQALYSKNYWEFGTDWQIFPKPNLKFILGFLSRYSTFPNRTVSEATVVTDRRGRIRITSQDGMETQTFTQVQGAVVKMIGKAEFRSSVGLSSQNSRSGYENYTETQVQASVLVPF